MHINNPLALSTVLSDPSAIKFREGSDDADFGGIDLSKNPQKAGSGPFVWVLNDSTEASLTVIGKVIYSAIGDKTGPYFSLPEMHYVPEVTTDEMGKAKAGFAVRLTNPDLVADVLSPQELHTHNQAVIEYFLTVQEAAEARLAAMDGRGGTGPDKPNVNVKSFLKVEDGNPFYVLPVISEPLFPQFKGPSTPGVTRNKRQLGKISLDPAKRSASGEDESIMPNRVKFGDLPDPKNRYARLKAAQTFNRYEMCVPPVFVADGNIVVPSKYEDMIPDGTLVAVRGKMKMYDILSRDRSFINRPFTFVFDRLQVIGDEMVGWSDAGSSPSNGKRRRFEMGPPQTKFSKYRVAVGDKMIDDA
ncbi:hypothetical protein BJ322DRAFT_178294 [Thelephora terrestris]|uniref:Uncharacterized protein n=1 Tax=Thelephora terrestris TaxID=56493 RepID=A0A9P6L5C3_9AGAM|nr:hypothetical protein BJ322DRAFT_178294 [Thelephora terrestris]